MNKPLVILNDSGKPAGGATKLAVDAAIGAAKRGWNVTYITQAGDLSVELTKAEVNIRTIKGARVVRDSPRAAMRTGLWNSAAYDSVSEFIAVNDTPSTVYHLHNWAHFFSPAIFKALRPVEARTVLTIHDYFLVCGNGGQYDFKKNSVCKRIGNSVPCLVTQCDRQSYIHKAWRIARQAIRGHAFPLKEFKGQAALIHDRQRPFFERAGFPSDRLRTISNPVEPLNAHRVKAEENQSALYIGRLSVEKGADIAAEAAERANMPIIFAGAGPMAKELARKYPNAEFAGFCDRAKLAELIRKSRCLILPSRLAEPFGLAAGEALWSGLPVLISRPAFLSSDIVSAKAGLDFDPMDIRSVEAALRRVKDDDSLVAQMSHSAFSDTAFIANTQPDWLEAYDTLYQSLLS